jgi:transposase
MKDLNCFSKVYLAVDPADFRKQARGLCMLVKQRLTLNPLDEKSLFVFVNRRRDAVRIVYWDLTGIAMWSKVLEKETYPWLKKAEGPSAMISAKELKWLLQGIDIAKLKKHEKLEFEETF